MTSLRLEDLQQIQKDYKKIDDFSINSHSDQCQFVSLSSRMILKLMFEYVRQKLQKEFNYQFLYFITQMQTQSNRPSIELSQTISKIDQLLRLYQMSKKSDPSKKSVVEKKVNEMVNGIKTDPLYPKINEFLNKKIQLALEDVKPPVKVQRQSSSNSSSQKSANYPSQEKQVVSQASVSSNMNSSSQEKSKPKPPPMPSIQALTINQLSSDSTFQNPSLPSLPSNPKSQSNLSSQMSNDKSQDNGFIILLDNLMSICHNFAGKAENLLAFNQDIFTTIKQTDDNSMVYLFGINNPERKNINKLYICTLMKFGSHQIVNSLDENGESKFMKEAKMFENNLRTPIGLIMCGKSIDNLSIEHVRFLAEIKSPLGVVIMMESFKEKKGTLFEFTKQTLAMSRDLNKVEYEQKTMDIRKQYGVKGKDLSKVQVVKDKLVITKNLARAITQSIESAQNAIQIESSNECIKQEPNRFPYKLHTKYYVSPKCDYQLFFLDNQLVAFKLNYKQKEFDQFKKYVMQQAQQKGNYLMSTSVLKENSEIKKEFWKLLVQCKSRDEYFLINLSGIANKKTIILSLKQNISESMIDNEPPFLFKDLEQSTDIINVVAIINKQNYKQFETESKIEVIDLTPKKR